MKDIAPSPVSKHKWQFFRSGGVDQVQIRDGADLAALAELDLKLWFALAMPASGVAADAATLKILDADSDGRVRPPELLAAIEWAKGAFSDLDVFFDKGDTLPLAKIRDESILRGARRVLVTVGKPDADAIALADVKSAAGSFAKGRFNGDGVVPASAPEDADTRQAIADIVASLDGVDDLSGQKGVNSAMLADFFSKAAAYHAWLAKADAATHPLGDASGAALEALNAVRDKIDDFFARAMLAAFDARAEAALGAQEQALLVEAAKDSSITHKEIAGLPLARVGVGGGLPLREGLNPAWADAMELFRQKAVLPILGDIASMSAAQWGRVKAVLAPHAAWLGECPAGSIGKLGRERIGALLAGMSRDSIAALIAEDAALKPEFDQIGALEKMLLLKRDLLTILNNYVNFSHFYSKNGAIFMAGDLYLDARTCHLCLDVADAGRHAALAGLAGIYLAYCDLKRPGCAPRSFVAAFTDGDSDNLMVGRNGVFFDREGRDWDATITKVVANPISIREAFWSPYMKLLRMIEEMVAKRAASAEGAASGKLSSAATLVTSADKPAAQPAPAKIDVGTVAALGVAVGAIGTTLSVLATGIMGLSWWQIPLVFVGIVLMISLPSMIIAWLKLRRRNIAPILDANGWAINVRAKISTPFGAALTDMARLPAGSGVSLADPFAEKRRPLGLYVLLVLSIAGAIWSVVHHGIGR
jgi:hypothetical protein